MKTIGRRKIVGYKLALYGVGDGLSEAVVTDPVVAEDLDFGDTVYVLCEATVKKIHLDVAKEQSNALIAELRLKGGVVTLVDKEYAHDTLEAQRVANEAARTARQEAAGIFKLPNDGAIDTTASDGAPGLPAGEEPVEAPDGE